MKTENLKALIKKLKVIQREEIIYDRENRKYLELIKMAFSQRAEILALALKEQKSYISDLRKNANRLADIAWLNEEYEPQKPKTIGNKNGT